MLRGPQHKNNGFFKAPCCHGVTKTAVTRDHFYTEKKLMFPFNCTSVVFVRKKESVQAKHPIVPMNIYSI